MLSNIDNDKIINAVTIVKMSSEIDQLVLSNIDNDKIIDVETTEIPTKKNIILLPDDMLKILCSWCPILGLTCKQLNGLCPIKPNGYQYNKISEWHLPIKYLFGGVSYWYYCIDLNCILPIIESDKFRSLNINISNDLFEVRKAIKFVCEKNIPFDNFKYSDLLKRAIKNQQNESGFVHLEYYNSIVMSMLMYLYH